LHLGPYVGAETGHTVIPLKSTGQVAESNATFRFQMLRQTLVFACSFTVKIWIVVPLLLIEKTYRKLVLTAI
jgi:GAF domain-containing protein